ncbi:hypothetical protein ACQPYE_09785 [Actinosynnema sp. CA-299493]
MTGNGGSTGDVGQYAFEQYRQQSGGGLVGTLTLGLSDIVAATKALAAASEAHSLSVDPHAVDSMLRKLTEMQDALGKVQRSGQVLTTHTPLGQGYAEAIGKVNSTLGQQAVGEVVPDVITAIDALKEQIEKSRASYRNVDEAKAQTFDNL